MLTAGLLRAALQACAERWVLLVDQEMTFDFGCLFRDGESDTIQSIDIASFNKL